MGKHTPPPWVVSSSVMVCTKEARMIANCVPMLEIPELCVPIDEARANARLISQAPAMLEALKELALSQNRAFLTPRLAKMIDEVVRAATVEERG